MLKTFAMIALAAVITTSALALIPSAAIAQGYYVAKRTVKVKHTSAYKAMIKSIQRPAKPKPTRAKRLSKTTTEPTKTTSSSSSAAASR